jgi:hypothetical protein
MRCLSRHSVLLLLGSIGLLVPAPADEAAAWAALRHGGYMALMRHVEAPRVPATRRALGLPARPEGHGSAIGLHR